MIASTRLARASMIVWAVALVTSGSATAESWRVTVRGQGGDLGTTPLVVELKPAPPSGNYVLQENGGKAFPARVFADGGKTYLGTVLDRVPKQAVRSYALRRDTKSEAPSAGVELRREGSNIEVLTGGKLLTVYRPDEGPKPYYYPVQGPTEAPFTRAFPMKIVAGETKDHPHQRSFWFTHGKVNGIDFWSEIKGHGSIKETSRKIVDSGFAVGVIRTTDDWLDPAGKRVCEDERVVRFYDTAASRMIDFDITLKATDGPLTFGDTKEGMFGLRVASSMDVDRKTGGKITNAEGLTDAAAWGKPSPWVDYSGPVEGRTVGVAILNHPDSFRYPTTWHVRTYGLFAANPFGWHDFGQKRSGQHTVPAGGSIGFRYRVILHDGDTSAANIPAAFEAYAKPPLVEIQAE